MKKQKDNVQVPQSGQIAVNTKEHSLLILKKSGDYIL